MQLISPAFEHNQQLPAKYTCKGENVNPPLQFVDVPQNAKSLTLFVDDPDAPSGTWVHWVVFNILATTTEIVENSTPQGTEGTTSFGTTHYGGPCPPAGSGTHRYIFHLFALDISLDLPNAGVQQLKAAMQGHVLQQAELIGLFGE